MMETLVPIYRLSADGVGDTVPLLLSCYALSIAHTHTHMHPFTHTKTTHSKIHRGGLCVSVKNTEKHTQHQPAHIDHLLDLHETTKA